LPDPETRLPMSRQRQPSVPDDERRGRSDEHPTVQPPYDVAAFAQDAMPGVPRSPRPASPHPASAERRRVVPNRKHSDAIDRITPTDPFLVEQARLKSAGALADDGDEAPVSESQYIKQLGSLDSIPVLRIPAEKLREMTFDHRAGFLLHVIDGVATLETVLDLSGMPRVEALRILRDLVAQRVVLLT
jgi:hypothetical protein